MKKVIILLSFFYCLNLHAEIFNINSRIFGGQLFQNEQNTGKACYVQINKIEENIVRGKHCHDINAQMMFGLDDIGVHHREMEIELQSRRTNNDTEFHLPGTCGEVTGDVSRPYEIDRWGEDTTYLFNQVFAAQYKINRFDNHYILIFSGKTKSPTRAMIHRVTWLKEISYECRNLSPM